ncbi:hypothetical protein [Pseudomonas sp. Marseille-QA0892]
MALEERTRPYQTVINHDPVSGVYVTHSDIYEVLKDGVVITQSVSQPKVLDGGDEALGEVLNKLLGDTATEILLQAKASAVELDAALQARAQAELERDETEKRLSNRASQLEQNLQAMELRAKTAEEKLAAISRTISEQDALRSASAVAE